MPAGKASDKPDFSRMSAKEVGLTLKDLQLAPGITIDEAILETGALQLLLQSSGSSQPAFVCDAVRFKAYVSEVNLNTLLAQHRPPDVPVKNLKASLLSGRVLLRGQFLKSVVAVPFAMEATPQITDGKQVRVRCSGSNVAGMALPAAAVQLIEATINEKLVIDLSDSPVPVTLTELVLEPGRIAASGTVVLQWNTLKRLFDASHGGR
jgi:LmeA-like phospholipid-binding